MLGPGDNNMTVNGESVFQICSYKDALKFFKHKLECVLCHAERMK